ncbi:MAG: lipopolysaccharide kinase InaA family protein [Planctomycetota bacterium]
MPVVCQIEPACEATLRDAGLTTYEAFMTTTLGEALVKPGLEGRERIRLTLAEQTFYLKRYALPARAGLESSAVRDVKNAGIRTMDLAATGAGPRGGFVMVTEVPGDALSRRFDELFQRFDGGPVVGEGLARQLGELAGRLHRAGLFHRDLYADHIFVDVRGDELELYLIDLARVFKPRHLRRWRWRLKDLAALKYSLPSDWTAVYWPTVLEAYTETLGRRLPPWAPLVLAVRLWRMKRHDANPLKPREPVKRPILLECENREMRG